MIAEAFLAEFKRLVEFFPKPPLKILNSENCEFGDNLYYCKNLYFAFDNANCSDGAYIYDSYLVANSLDCDYAVESELCYESVDPFKCFNCNYLEYCANLRDSYYCYNCIGGSDLFGCTNLINKSFCIFNRQLTEGEYREKVKELKKLPAEKILAIVEDLKKKFPLTQTIGAHNENTTFGNYIHNDKNCYLCFDAAQDENCAYVYDTFYCKNTLDATYGGQNVELSYEIISCPDLFNCNYIIWSKRCNDSSYLFNCFDVKDSLGCVDLAHKQYCILNRQFTKEEYEEISAQILKELAVKNVGWNDFSF